MDFDFKDVFLKLEESVINNSGLSKQEFEKEFCSFRKLAFIKHDDNWYFDRLKQVVFYSGFKARTVTSKLDVIDRHFPNFKKVAKYGEKDIAKIMKDKDMIKHPGKIKGIINNATIFSEIINQYGSVHDYLETFKPNESLENLMNFYKIIQKKFDYIGKITAFHFMTEIGLNCVKPDRVLVRIFQRLGLIENNKQYLKLNEEARKFAQATEFKIRYIDVIFVVFGQVDKRGICLQHNPKCELCKINNYCKYYKDIMGK